MSFRKIRLLTAGESHGPALTVILEGLPAQLALSEENLRYHMKRRQMGFGRGARMKIETDDVEITGGLRFGKTIGSPVSMVIRNRDFENWKDLMEPWAPVDAKRSMHRPRPGHADLAGGLKYGEKDLRNILERASARETAARTAAGAVCRQFLEQGGIQLASHVLSIGKVEMLNHNVLWDDIQAVQESDRLRCVDPKIETQMLAEIEEARQKKETLGGMFQVVARNVPPGLGSHVQWDQKIDGRIAQAMLAIPAVKGVAIGDAFGQTRSWGSEAHDEIFYESGRGFFRRTNFAGGTEGGITNGEELRVTAMMKPLSTLMKPLRSVDIISKEPQEAVVERSDVCSVPAAGVIGEAMLALVLTDALLEKFSCDSMPEFLAALQYYRDQLLNY